MIAEPQATAETADIVSSVNRTLVDLYGLDVQTISMVKEGEVTGLRPIIRWRVNLAYLGDAIPISHVVVASMSDRIVALGGVHKNSLWTEDVGLVTESHAAWHSG